jgi:hypothetical protein
MESIRRLESLTLYQRRLAGHAHPTPAPVQPRIEQHFERRFILLLLRLVPRIFERQDSTLLGIGLLRAVSTQSGNRDNIRKVANVFHILVPVIPRFADHGSRPHTRLSAGSTSIGWPRTSRRRFD